MKKRLLSLLLTVCLTASLFAGLSVPAAAYTDNGVSGYLVPYTFQAGDTIYGVCEKRKIDFNANLDKIGKINSITNYNYMMPGKVLWLPSATATSDQPHYTLHNFTVTAGDTLAAISQTYGGFDYNRDYKILAALNNNLNMLIAGQKLIVPTYVDPKGAASDGDAVKPAPAPGGGTTPGGGTIPAGDGVSYYLAQHVLQAGETVSGICAGMGINFMTISDQIMKINNIASYNYMLPGKLLLIPTKAVPTSGSYYKVMAHTVAAGDTVWDLCTKYGLNFYTYQDLIKKLNNRTNLNTFYPGQIMLMPAYTAAPTAGTVPAGTTPAGTTPAGTTPAGTTPAGTTPAGTTPAVPAGTTPAAGTLGPTAPGVPDPTLKLDIPKDDTLTSLVIPHVLQAGETVSGICAAMGIDFTANADKIAKLSNIANYNYLLPGKLILIPSMTYPTSGPYYKIMAHTVVAGDTVWGLCIRYGLNYNNNITFIQRLNGRDNMATYYPGQIIYMPLYASAG